MVSRLNKSLHFTSRVFVDQSERGKLFSLHNTVACVSPHFIPFPSPSSTTATNTSFPRSLLLPPYTLASNKSLGVFFNCCSSLTFIQSGTAAATMSPTLSPFAALHLRHQLGTTSCQLPQPALYLCTIELSNFLIFFFC